MEYPNYASTGEAFGETRDQDKEVHNIEQRRESYHVWSPAAVAAPGHRQPYPGLSHVFSE
jgi:hypothetical protein